MKPLVSILIPCYNAEQWLVDTLASALAQTWMNTEIIVVDDGSTDSSLSVAKGFASPQSTLLASPIKEPALPEIVHFMRLRVISFSTWMLMIF